MGSCQELRDLQRPLAAFNENVYDAAKNSTTLDVPSLNIPITLDEFCGVLRPIEQTLIEKKITSNIGDREINVFVCSFSSSSIDDVLRQPCQLRLPTFVRSSTYKDRCLMMKLLNLTGYPGTGKSEFVRSLAQKFPFDNRNTPPLAVKWHIQCKDKDDDIRVKLEDLVDPMVKIKSLPLKPLKLRQQLSKGKATLLVQSLVKCPVPVLIIIEDPPANDGIDDRIQRELLTDLCSSIKFQQKIKAKLHIYITSRDESLSTEKNELATMEYFTQEKVHGFTLEASPSCLEPDIDKPLKHSWKIEDNRHLTTPYDFFTKMPCYDLRGKLFPKRKKTYKQQCDEIEKAFLHAKKFCEENFEILITRIQSENYSDLRWKVLCCLSYLHYDRIPKFFIECCIEKLRGKTLAGQEAAETVVQRIVEDLEEYNVCTVEKNDIIFHRLFQNATLCSYESERSNEDDFDALKVSIEVFWELMTKNFLETKYFDEIQPLLRHLQVILQHVERDVTFFDREDSIFLKAVVSHLYETAGMILNKFSDMVLESEKFFCKAAALLWGDKLRFYALKSNQSKKEIEEIAASVMEQSKYLGEKLQDSFFWKLRLETASCLLKLQGKPDLQYIPKSLRLFWEENQSDGAFMGYLDNDKHRPVFYAERLASIFHNWSGVILYAKSDKLDQYPIYKHMSTLSRLISEECRKSYEVPLLVEHLSITRMISILLMKIEEATVPEQLKELGAKALDLQEGNTVYDNGFAKKLQNVSDNIIQLTILADLVLLYAMLMKTRDPDQALKDEDKKCQKLLNSAFKSSVTNSGLVLCNVILCCKYYVTKKNFEQAQKCFEIYFDALKEAGVKPRSSLYYTAANSFARVVQENPNEAEKRSFISMCKKVLGSEETMAAASEVGMGRKL